MRWDSYEYHGVNSDGESGDGGIQCFIELFEESFVGYGKGRFFFLWHALGRRIVESFELTVMPEPGENKQAQTQAVSCSYSHLCGSNMQVLRGVRSDG